MVKEVSQEELEQIVKDTKICVVDFSATWCGPCKSLSKVLEAKVVPHFENDPDVSLVKIDIDKNQELAQALNVMSVPSMMFFFNGQRLVFQDDSGKQQDRITGYDPNIDQVIFAVVEQLKNDPKGKKTEESSE
jgi:thioredoxin-like negative regulator of GroEL